MKKQNGRIKLNHIEQVQLGLSYKVRDITKKERDELDKISRSHFGLRVAST